MSDYPIKDEALDSVLQFITIWLHFSPNANYFSHWLRRRVVEGQGIVEQMIYKLIEGDLQADIITEMLYRLRGKSASRCSQLLSFENVV